MHPSKVIMLLVMMQLTAIMLPAQRPDTTSADIDFKIESNKATFTSALRPLRQIAGAPEAFYTHYWEFGDGKFSFEASPTHIFKDTGSYDVLYYATNNYDDGKPPPRRRKKVPVKNKALYAQQKASSFFKTNGAIEMKVNRMPRAGEEMVMIIGYRNESMTVPQNGSLVLFYNEKHFRASSFDLEEERAYHGERTSSLNSIAFLENKFIESVEENSVEENIVSGPNAAEATIQNNIFAGRFSDLLRTKQQQFRQNNVWRFENLQQGEEKYFFLTLYTLPEMIKDTNTVVTLNGMFIPDDPNGGLEEYELELQIVASHDPNRMQLRNRRLNYRFTGTKKEMTYKVRFQNTGKGPAKQINVGIVVPPLLNPQSLEVLDQYPKCIPCDSADAGQSCMDTIISKDSIHFVFKDIYLPGLRQDGFCDPDSTSGFIKYRLQFSKKLKKLPFESRATIVFDNNKPIYTNSPRGYFKPGLSPAAIIGYNRWLDIGNKNQFEENYWTLGASVSPYSPYKKYFQWELFAGFINQPERLVSRGPGRDTMINGQLCFQQNIDRFDKSKTVKLAFVPLQLRYNVIDWVGAGVGSMVTTDAVIKTSVRKEIFVICPTPPPMTFSIKEPATTDYFKNWDVSVFADVQLGKVRAGPAAGLRFIHYFINPQNRLMIYATWRL